MEEKYENKLYGKIEFLHERAKQNHISLINFSEVITKFINSISDFSKTLNNLKYRKSKIIEEKYSTIYNLTHFFKLNLKVHIDEFKECADHLNVIILGPIIKSIDEKYIKEKELYNNYHKIKNISNNLKINLEKSRKEFEINAKLCEQNILNFMQLKSYMNNSDYIPKIEERMKLSIIKTKTLEDKYWGCLEDANKARENEVNKQKEILNYYQTIDIDFYSKIYCMISFVVPLVKKMYSSVLKSLEGLEEQCKKVKINHDIISFMDNNKSDILPEEPIKFIPYFPEANLETNTSGNERKDLETLDINYNVLLTLYENFREIRKDLNMDEEKKKYRLRYLCSQIFKIGPGVDFKQEEKNELINFLNEKEYKTYFLITLSKQRTKGRYQKTEILLKDLSEIFNFILDSSEKEKDYEGAKNCIILSQTFYYEKQKGNDKKKKYLLDYIKNHNWLKSLEFWEGLTDFMIQGEIKKNEDINKKNNFIETPEQIKSRLGNIYFSQVLSISNSMIEFMIDKNDIYKLVDIFVNKYEIEKSIKQVIYENIKNTPYQIDDHEEEEDIKEKKNKQNIKRKIQKNNNDNLKEDNIKIKYNKLEEKNNTNEKEINKKENKKIAKLEVDNKNEIIKNYENDLKNENIWENEPNKDDIKKEKIEENLEENKNFEKKEKNGEKIKRKNK